MALPQASLSLAKCSQSEAYFTFHIFENQKPGKDLRPLIWGNWLMKYYAHFPPCVSEMHPNKIWVLNLLVDWKFSIPKCRILLYNSTLVKLATTKFLKFLWNVVVWKCAICLEKNWDLDSNWSMKIGQWTLRTSTCVCGNQELSIPSFEITLSCEVINEISLKVYLTILILYHVVIFYRKILGMKEKIWFNCNSSLPTIFFFLAYTKCLSCMSINKFRIS